METTSERLAVGRSFFQAGDLGRAGQIYQAILQADPNQVGALYGLGQIAFQLFHFDQAVAWLRRAIALEPSNPFLHNNLGTSLGAMGQTKEAETCFREALRLMPDYAEAYYNLGNALKVQGQLREAIFRFWQAILARPDYAVAYHNLGLALLEQGNLEETVTVLSDAVRIWPDWPGVRQSLQVALRRLELPVSSTGTVFGYSTAAAWEERQVRTEGMAYFNRGLELAGADQLREAVTALRHAQRLLPDFAEAYLELGNVLRKQGRLELALGYLRHALRNLLNLAHAHVCLGRALADAGQMEAAENAFREGLIREPDSVSALGQLCNLLEEQGRMEESSTLLEEALARKPGVAVLRSHYGRVLMILGRLDEARRQFHQALAIQPDLTPPYISLARDGRNPVSAEQRATMSELLASKTLPMRDRINLHFALAHILDRDKDFDQAFFHCHQANETKQELLRRQGNTFQLDGQTRYIDRLIAAFGPDFFRRMLPFGSEAELPVFIVGMPRSGTTLVEQILASHPAVFGAGETRNMQGLVAMLGKPAQYPESVQQLGGDAVLLAEYYLARLRRQGQEKLRVTDKLQGNFHHLGLIAALFPRARIIHCRRDPRDTCWSCYFHNFQEVTYNCELATLGGYYREYERLMAHWNAFLPVPVFEIRYEEMVEDTERVSRDMVAYCGLDWHEDCLHFYESRRPVRTASNLQVRQPVYKHAVGHWKNYAAHLAPLLDALGSLPD